MHKKISLLLLLSTSLVISADHHAMKGDQSKKETKKLEMEKRGCGNLKTAKRLAKPQELIFIFLVKLLKSVLL